MSTFIAQIVVFCFFAAVIIDASIAPYCMHPGFACQSPSRCNSSLQVCDCPHDVYGSVCELPRTLTVPNHLCGGCGPGFCYEYYHEFTGYVEYKCHCPYDFCGTNCQFKNFTVNCNLDDMQIDILTPGVKAVFVNGDENCYFLSNSSRREMNSGLYKYAMTIPYEGKCNYFRKRHISRDISENSIVVDVRERGGGYWSGNDFSKAFSCRYYASQSQSIQESSEENKAFEAVFVDENDAPLFKKRGHYRVMARESFGIAFYPTESKLRENSNYVVGISLLKMINVRNSKKMFEIVRGDCLTQVGRELLLRPIIEVKQFKKKNGNVVTATILHFGGIGNKFHIHFEYHVHLCDTACPNVDCRGVQLPNSFKGMRIEVQ